MFTNYNELSNYIREKEVKSLDFKIVDLNGRWKHLTIPAKSVSRKLFETGFGFDGSNYGYAKVENSDMVYIPEIKSAILDPFWKEKVLSFVGNIYEITPQAFIPSIQDPRNILQKASKYLENSGIADTFFIGPEFEYNIFDGIKYTVLPQKLFAEIESSQTGWNSCDKEDKQGYTIPHKSGYHVSAPYDRYMDLRNEIVMELGKIGVDVKYHHHEVGACGQQEIELNMSDAVLLGDHSMLVKYFIKNMAFAAGKTATFMPKPIYGEAGNGFHIHMQLIKDNETIFSDDNGICGLSKEALYFMGGILKHSPALLAFCAPSTNSYKRLINGFEAPVAICFGASNRSAVIRIPGYAKEKEKRRFEFRAPDSTCNPYLAFASVLMAGIDGIKNEIDPIEEGYGPVESNIYELVEHGKIKFLPDNLSDSIRCLADDNEFLKQGEVFDKLFIDNWIKIKNKEIEAVNKIPHPKEFDLYYDL